MFIPKTLKKWIAVFRGDIAPGLILLSVLLGFWFGLTPGWQGLHVALLAIALILNVHFGLFVIWAGFGKAFCYGLAPLMYHAGLWTQDSLTVLLDSLAAVPIVGLTDFARAVWWELFLGWPILKLHPDHRSIVS